LRSISDLALGGGRGGIAEQLRRRPFAPEIAKCGLYDVEAEVRQVREYGCFAALSVTRGIDNLRKLAPERRTNGLFAGT
jgi:hypothetical protein